jgi:hypothetical protein
MFVLACIGLKLERMRLRSRPINRTATSLSTAAIGVIHAA